jgi:hypothetical protein
MILLSAAEDSMHRDDGEEEEQTERDKMNQTNYIEINKI